MARRLSAGFAGFFACINFKQDRRKPSCKPLSREFCDQIHTQRQEHFASLAVHISLGARMHSLSALLPVVKHNTLIRTLDTADLARFHAYRSDADLAKYQGWSPMNMEGARAFIDKMASVSDLKPGDWIQLAIADSRSNEILGDVGLYLETDQSVGELGFTLCRAAQGQGHATRAARLSLSLLFAASSVPVVRAVTDVRNLSSARVLERASFLRSSVQQAIFKGEPCVELVYVCRRSEAPSQVDRSK